MVSAMVWTGIPLMVTIFTIYGFWRKKHKYFYPFLIISVVQLIVCLIMGVVIATFAFFNYDTLKMIIGKDEEQRISNC
jgi:ATP/ADP translocase